MQIFIAFFPDGVGKRRAYFVYRTQAVSRGERVFAELEFVFDLVVSLATCSQVSAG
jgi:hypothetical protein